MSASPMKRLAAVGHKPHPLDRKKYGQPYFALYWASPRHRFTAPGLYVWTGKRNVRVIPMPRRA
jgi:hypothetical protein